MEFCSICPRNCRVDREKIYGFCNESKKIKIAKVCKHFSWEEPCLSDNTGTLAIFFSGCNLRCDYCQNYEISRGGVGKEYSIQEFRNLIEANQESHSSIDLITPTHFADEIIAAFAKISKKVPVIWNTNGYETTETIEKVSKFVDIFLPDLKYSQNNLGAKFSKCKDYFSFAIPAIKKMCDLKKDVFSGERMLQGVIIRHLVLPSHVENSFEVLDVISKNFPDRFVSVMSQFTPNGKSELNRRLTPIEYKAVVAHMKKLGLKKGYVQDFESASQNFVPDFGQQEA